MSGIFLGIKTQNPVVGITSTNPGTANAMLAAQQMAQAQQQPQPVHQIQSGIKDKVLLYTKCLGTKHILV